MKKTFTCISALVIATLALSSFTLPVPAGKKVNTIYLAEEHKVGDLFGGGIIFSISKGADGVEHGLIVSLGDISTEAEWSSNTRLATGATSATDGRSNTATILKAGTSAKSAAGLCEAYVAGEFSDWYLPAIDELKTLHAASAGLNKILEGNSKAQILDARWCWSSTEEARGSALGFSFLNGESSMSNKLRTGSVRAVRTF